MLSNQQRVEAEKQGKLFKKKRREMTTAERVGMLQEKLYCKAKQARDYKFYILYDKMFIPYMLQEAYKRVKQNVGAPGIDGQSIQDIEEIGLENYLNELGQELRSRRYKPQPVKRVWIDKANGGKRPLGIPTVRDRVAQTVCKMIIEPIFEADFEESSYGFRPERSSKDAMKAIKACLQEGKTEVLDADLSLYFDTIPHDKLMKVMELRIADPRILHLIMLWLKSPIQEDGQIKGGKKQKEGTPQGGVISPLLANIYMHLVDKMVSNPRDIFHRSGIRIVRYADDFVLLGEKITEQSMNRLRGTLTRMGLTLNEQKTRQVQARDTAFNFLGFTIRYDNDIYGAKKRYWNIVPSDTSENKIREKVRVYLRRNGHSTPRQIAEGMNTILRGWLNYFDIPKISYAAVSKRNLRHYLQESLCRYYHRKSQRRSRLYGTQAFELLVCRYGLMDPMKYKVNG